MSALRDFLTSFLQQPKQVEEAVPSSSIIIESDFSCLQYPKGKAQGGMEDYSGKISLTNLVGTESEADPLSSLSLGVNPSA